MNKKSKTALSANGTNSFLRRTLIVFPYLWLVLFFLIPFLYVFKISFSTPILAQPPYSQIFDFSQNFTNWLKLTWDNFLFFLEDNLYWISYLKSIKVAAISTILCLIIGYPLAYGIARASTEKRNILLMLVILPFWTSFVCEYMPGWVSLGKMVL